MCSFGEFFGIVISKFVLIYFSRRSLHLMLSKLYVITTSTYGVHCIKCRSLIASLMIHGFSGHVSSEFKSTPVHDLCFLAWIHVPPGERNWMKWLYLILHYYHSRSPFRLSPVPQMLGLIQICKQFGSSGLTFLSANIVLVVIIGSKSPRMTNESSCRWIDQGRVE